MNGSRPQPAPPQHVRLVPNHGARPRAKIALVVTRFVAGAGGVALRGALALDRDRFEVTIFAANGGRLLDEASAEGLEVIRLEHMRPEISPLEDRRCVGELIEMFQDQAFDLVHTHSAKAGAVGRIAARRTGVPAIVHTFHGFPFHGFQSRARRAAYIRAERRLGRSTDMFFAVGAQTAADAVRLRIAAPERVRAILSPVASDVVPLTRTSRAEARRLLHVPPGMRVVGSVGRLDYQKAPHDLIEAVASIESMPVCAVWIGDGPLRPKMERLIRDKGLSDRFLLVGERDDVSRLLPAFDVFAMSSLYEGLPCAVVEAMLCGIPVVATAVNSVPEVVIPGATGLLARAGDASSLSSALDHLLKEPEEGARMAAAARDLVGDRFTGEVLGRELTEVYDHLLGRPSPMATSNLGREVKA
jgi:glycosyltransferase involved in cell wall biosynthesis